MIVLEVQRLQTITVLILPNLDSKILNIKKMECWKCKR